MLLKFYTIKKGLILLLICWTQISAQAQVYSNKEVGKKNKQVVDSLKSADYPFVLPILGKKATRAGFNLPYSAGININYLWQESDLIIDNLQVGFNHGPMHDLSEVVRFDNAQATATAMSVRPDIWVLPFLNIYGIFAKSQPSTEVDFGIYIPDEESNWHNVVSLHTEANFEATTLGFGITPTIGVGGGWMAFDMNFSWSDISELDEPAFAFVMGPRLGKTFKLKKSESNIALWVGGFRLQLNTDTQGSIPLSEIFATQGLQEKVDNGLTKVEDGKTQVDGWWNSLTPAEQKNPVNKAKYETANRALDSAASFLNGLDGALNDEQQASVQYSLSKRHQDLWNFIIGSQYQYNKHWMLRLEAGFLSSRTQFIGGIQYRFGL
jgi:hypothetical protein